MCGGPSFAVVVAAGVGWQRWLKRSWQGLIPDLDEEIVAAVWEQYQAGVVDQDRLFAATRVSLRRVARREGRAGRVAHAARSGLGLDGGVDAYERVMERLVATEVVAGLVVPARAEAWVRVMSVGGSASARSMESGRRWANRVRDELRAGGVGHAAA